jgi:hypothetical protein
VAADFTLKAGDTSPEFVGKCLDQTKTPVPTLGATVRFRMRPQVRNLRSVIDTPAVWSNPATAEATHLWAPDETAVPGLYDAEFHVVWADGKSESFPNDEYVIIEILPAAGDVIPPSPPTNLDALIVGAHDARVTWTAGADEEGGSGLASHLVYKNGVLAATVLAPATQWDDPSVSVLSQYQIYAVDKAGNRSAPAGPVQPHPLVPYEPVLVVTSMTQVPSGAHPDGQLLLLRVGTYPDVEDVLLVWDAADSRWIGRDVIPMIAQLDQGYLSFNNVGDWEYLSSVVGAGGTATQTGWTQRAIPRAGALYAAGLRLEVLLTGLLCGNAADTGSVKPYFFQFDSGDNGVTLNGLVPVAGTLGPGPSVTSEVTNLQPGVYAGVFRSSGWQELAITPPTKNNLLAQLFTQKNGALSASRCQAIDFSLLARWVGGP